MLSFIHADSWKLFHTKSFFIVLITAVILMGLFGLAIDVTTRVSYDDYLKMQEQQTGVKVSTQEAVHNKAEYEAYQESVRQRMKADFYIGMVTSESGVLYLLYGLFMSVFLVQDYAKGYIKNIINVPNAKRKWILSKIVLSAIVAAVYLVAVIAFGSLFGHLKVGELGYTIQSLLPFALGQFMGLVAFSSLLILFVIMFQQTLPVVLISIALSLKFHGLLIGLIDELKFLPFNLTKYGLFNQLYGLKLGTVDIKNFVLQACIYTVVAALLSWFYFRKSDIKC